MSLFPAVRVSSFQYRLQSAERTVLNLSALRTHPPAVPVPHGRSTPRTAPIPCRSGPRQWARSFPARLFPSEPPAVGKPVRTPRRFCGPALPTGSQRFPLRQSALPFSPSSKRIPAFYSLAPARVLSFALHTRAHVRAYENCCRRSAILHFLFGSRSFHALRVDPASRTLVLRAAHCGAAFHPLRGVPRAKRARFPKSVPSLPYPMQARPQTRRSPPGHQRPSSGFRSARSPPRGGGAAHPEAEYCRRRCLPSASFPNEPGNRDAARAVSASSRRRPEHPSYGSRSAASDPQACSPRRSLPERALPCWLRTAVLTARPRVSTDRLIRDRRFL